MPRLIPLVLLQLAMLLPAATASAARQPVPQLGAVRCVPATTPACRTGVAVRTGKQVQLRGTGLRAGLRVSFR